MKAVALITVATLASALAEDWPTYRHDDRRSGVTSASLDFPLEEVWSRISPIPPMTAWSGPAKWDAYSGNEGLQSMRNFDPALFVTAAGGAVYFGSSIDHAAHCLDAATGEERWVAFAGGAVRLPPSIVEGRAYFGCDRGFAYCVDTSTGATVWRHRPAGDPRLIPSDGKIISPWPVRTGVLVRGGLAFFAASLVPWETSYLCAVDAATGERKLLTEHRDVTLQGAMLASSTSLFVPQGRSVPLVFDLGSGERLKDVGGAGGTFCLLTEDDRLVAMPQNQRSAGDVIRVADPSGGAAMLSFADADRLLVEKGVAFVHQRGKLRALDLERYTELHNEIRTLDTKIKAAQKRSEAVKKHIAAKPEATELKNLNAEFEKAQGEIAGFGVARAEIAKQIPGCSLWETDAPAPFDLIKAGAQVFVGGEARVVAYDAKTGERRWQAEVRGKSYGLAVAEGRLFVSTSRGHIYCFSGRR